MTAYLVRLLRSAYKCVKQYRYRYKEAALRRLLPLFSPIVRVMAESGFGTDACLGLGCLPVKVHYYSPVPDIGDLKSRRVWARRSDMSGISFKETNQVKLMVELGRDFGHECQWPHSATGDPTQFFTDNSGFSYGCAAATHSLLRRFKPRQVIEIGSGSSSRVIASALRANVQSGSPAAQYTVIDPFPGLELEKLPGVTRLLKQKVEETDVALFLDLRANDVLFIDSGHTVRIGGDVNFLILDVLPVLAPGVLVHFHDIPLPYEYAEVYYTNPRFRMFWTESYLLQAFLCFNAAYDILLAMNYLMLDRLEEFRAAFACYDPAIHRYPSHSFWIRRV